MSANAHSVDNPLRFSLCVITADHCGRADRGPENRRRDHVSVNQDGYGPADAAHRRLAHLLSARRIELPADAVT
jgi:hypothetical protein